MNNLREFINSKQLKFTYQNNKLNIVNYDEIMIITDTKIILLKDNNPITIKGNELTLLKLLDRETLIGGCIKTIEM